VFGAGEVAAFELDGDLLAALTAQGEDGVHVGDFAGADAVGEVGAAFVLEVLDAQGVLATGGDSEIDEGVEAVGVFIVGDAAAGGVEEGQGGVELGTGAEGLDVEDEALAFFGVEAEAIDVEIGLDLAGDDRGEGDGLGFAGGVVGFFFGDGGEVVDEEEEGPGDAVLGDEAQLARAAGGVGGGGEVEGERLDGLRGGRGWLEGGGEARGTQK
jgi:hypothetical protein